MFVKPHKPHSWAFLGPRDPMGHFFKNYVSSVFFLFDYLISCRKYEKKMLSQFWNLGFQTDRWTEPNSLNTSTSPGVQYLHKSACGCIYNYNCNSSHYWIHWEKKSSTQPFPLINLPSFQFLCFGGIVLSSQDVFGELIYDQKNSEIITG